MLLNLAVLPGLLFFYEGHLRCRCFLVFCSQQFTSLFCWNVDFCSKLSCSCRQIYVVQTADLQRCVRSGDVKLKSHRYVLFLPRNVVVSFVLLLLVLVSRPVRFHVFGPQLISAVLCGPQAFQVILNRKWGDGPHAGALSPIPPSSPFQLANVAIHRRAAVRCSRRHAPHWRVVDNQS